jgi:hypothetical protein
MIQSAQTMLAPLRRLAAEGDLFPAGGEDDNTTASGRWVGTGCVGKGQARRLKRIGPNELGAKPPRRGLRGNLAAGR